MSVDMLLFCGGDANIVEFGQNIPDLGLHGLLGSVPIFAIEVK